MATSFRDAVLSLSPVLYWVMNETTGTVANDLAAGNHDGTHNGPAVGGYPLTPDDGDHAVEYDGSDDHTISGSISIPGGLQLPVTLLAVVRVLEEEEDGCVLEYSDASADTSTLRMDMDGGSLAMSANGTSFERTTSPKRHDDGVRHLGIVTFESQTVRTMWIDLEDAVQGSGNSVGLQSSSTRKVAVGDDLRDLGANNLGFLKGQVSHVAIFHGSLTADDRKMLWDAFRPRGRFFDAVQQGAFDNRKAGFVRMNQANAIRIDGEPGVVNPEWQNNMDDEAPNASHNTS